MPELIYPPAGNVLAHIAHVAMPKRRNGALDFQARCSCGWTGRKRTTDHRAWLDVEAHEAKHPLNSHDTTTLSEGATR